MTQQHIKNYDLLATDDRRKTALALVNAALDAIDTGRAIRSAVAVCADSLKIRDHIFSFRQFQRVFVFGIGKAATQATVALEQILGDRLAGGVVIGTEAVSMTRLRVLRGDHPLPSPANVAASGEMVALSKQMTVRDLALVIVSGGGSAHLSWPESEREQGERLYHNFVRVGGTIVELNTVRKHLSQLKGGGLAKVLFPATVVGLIFSDVPGGQFESVASGPTYFDKTTVKDAEQILKKYHIEGCSLTETPKESRLFGSVVNLPLVSNRLALEAMQRRAAEMGLEAEILSDCLFDPVAEVAAKMFDAAQRRKASVILAGGEPEVKVPAIHGRGGRNQHLALHSLSNIKEGQLFLSFGSDGVDNGAAAGAIADAQILEKARQLALNPADYLRRFDAQTFFERTAAQILTGPTHANVSDLMLLVG